MAASTSAPTTPLMPCLFAIRPIKPSWRPTERSGAADQLLVDELVGAVGAELAAEAGALEAAERQLRAVGEDQVDVDHPGFDPVRHALALLGIGRHYVGAEAERSLVG